MNSSSTSPGRPAILPLLLCGIGLAGAVRPSAGDWQALLVNSPFGQVSAVQTGGKPGEPEFRGVVEEGGNFLVNLYDPGTKTAQWLPVPGLAPGLKVEAYDAGAQQVRIDLAGRALVLPLKRASVSLTGNAAPLQLINPADPPPAEEVAGLPEFMRNLPPEARRMLEEVRRRRAIREPFPGATAVPADKPSESPPRARPAAR